MNKLTRTISLVFVFALSGTAFITGVNAQFMQDPGRNLNKKTFDVSKKSRVELPGRTTSTYRSSATTSVIELRAFDFSDVYYSGHGIIPSMIINRHNGIDGRSVSEQNSNKSYRDVRVLENWPLYNAKGRMFFYAELGQIGSSSFVDYSSRKVVKEMAEKYPIYKFPSTRTSGKERQVRIGEIGNSYFEENSLGVSEIIDVIFTNLAYTKAGDEYLSTVLGPNGVAEDGSYRIRTREQVQDLTLAGFLLQRPRLDENGKPLYMIGKVFENPEMGGITSDAYLNMVRDTENQPLRSEMEFHLQFECLRTTGNLCG